MNFEDNNLTCCDQMLPSIILYIDHEIFENDELRALENHFTECLGCKQVMEQETRNLNKVRQLLCNALSESVPEDLTAKITLQIEDLYNQMLQSNQPQTITEFTYTQTTYTEFTPDGATQIEITSEIRREFPLE
ncbi:MAG: hypothetical protein EBZ41_00265 [Actinobacteria bacterium]|nr:hypothetical protein [Actinomycetota bacterium]